MGQASIDAVLAGTKGFAVALLAPLTSRIGNRPRVAADPGQVLGLCSGPSALAVVEFTGEGSLTTIQALVRDGRGLRVVAGVPSAHAAAEGTLLAMGVEVGRWDGKIDGVIAAVDRAVAAMAAAPAAQQPKAPAAQRPSQPAPAAKPVASGVAAPARPSAAAVRPAAGTPRPSPPTAPVAAPRASQPAVPAVATAAAARSAMPPAVAATRLAAPPAGRPAAAPAPSAAAPRPAVAGDPPRPAVAGDPPRPAVVGDPPPPTLTRGPAQPPAGPAAQARPAAATPRPAAATPPPDATRRAPAAPPAVAPPGPPAAAAPAPAVAPPAAAAAPAPSVASRPAANFFDDLDGDDVPIDEEPPPPEVDFHAPGVYVPRPPTAAVQWPSGLCTDAEAEAALRAALSGAQGSTLEALAAKVLEAASDLERDVLAGKPQPIDTAPLRRAMVMRLRVAEALDSAPPVGSPFDAVAVSAILGQIDGMLAEVAPLLQNAPEELAPALESVRNALVREAIDFSEAASRLGKPDAPAAPKPPSARPAAARVVSIESGAEVQIEKAERRRAWMAYLLLAVVAIVAIGYHGWRYHQRLSVPRPRSLPGAPSGSVASVGRGNVQLVVSPNGRFDSAELQRFKAEQELQGNSVVEISPGVLRVAPAPAAKK